MSDTRYLDWPFFEPRHVQMQRELDAWAREHITQDAHADVDGECRALVAALGDGGWLRHAVAGTAYGGAGETLDTRALCLMRETLARHSGLADFAFAMQGLGSGAISLHGTAAQKERYLTAVARGKAIAAFALSEPEAGSDVAAMSCSARIDGDHAVLNGEKTWISNGGIADFYVVFVRSGEAEGVNQDGTPGRGAKGISAFIVDDGLPGFDIAERIDVIAPHPLARLSFHDCRIPLSQRIGEGGQGFKIAMQTLDVFRTSVAAAALGMARRALDEALQRATTRKMFKQMLSDFNSPPLRAFHSPRSRRRPSASFTSPATWIVSATAGGGVSGSACGSVGGGWGESLQPRAVAMASASASGTEYGRGEEGMRALGAAR